MSDSHDQHQSPIKSPKQLAWIVIASFVLPVVIIALLVNYVTSSSQTGAGSEGLGAQAVERRIEPVGRVELRDASTAVLRTGEQVYNGQCAACHGVGAAGAPKLGDVAAWEARVKTGYDTLLASALKGKGAMAPQGGGEFSDYEIARAVVFMANKGGAKLDEPKAPAAAASAAEASASAPK